MKSAGITSVLSSEPPTAVLPEPAADKCLLPIFLFPYHLNLSEQANIKITVTYFHQWLPLVWLLPSQVPWNKLLPKKKGGITATVTGQGELDAGNSDLCFCVRLLHQSWQASNSRYDAEDKLWKHNVINASSFGIKFMSLRSPTFRFRFGWPTWWLQYS